MTFFESFTQHVSADVFSVSNMELTLSCSQPDQNIDGQPHDSDPRLASTRSGSDAGDLRARHLTASQPTNSGDFQTKILIVEDEGIVALDIKNTLNRLGYHVTAVASTGWDAIQQAKRTKPDLVLMDIRLHGEMDGIEAAAYIHQELAIPVIFLTAQADGPTRQRADAVEHAGYLIKPFSVHDLETSLTVALLNSANDQSEV